MRSTVVLWEEIYAHFGYDHYFLREVIVVAAAAAAAAAAAVVQKRGEEDGPGSRRSDGDLRDDIL